jgi:DNA polymerase III delta prime subunit
VFDNLLGQDEVLNALRSDIEGDRLPPALLLSGPPGSGKMTAALEIARVLSCARGASGHERAAWGCGCPSCNRHRVLAHPDLLLLGRRSFPEEIKAALELLGRFPGPAASYFFVRAARKLARRFDAALYAGEETRLAKAAPLLRELEEQLGAIAPDKARQGENAPGAIEAAAKAAEAAAKLESFAPDMPPVFMIRNAEGWAHLAPLGPRKTIIIENADRMQEGARNALLKILEEPPESLRFVLVTSRRSAMMTTILSRARTYSFAARDQESTAAVVQKVFRSSEPAASVEDFLAARRSFPPAQARAQAAAFLGAALASRPDNAVLAQSLQNLAREAQSARGDAGGAAALASLLEATKDFGQKDESYASSFQAFLSALSELLGDLVSEEGSDAAAVVLAERIAMLLRQAMAEYESLNRSPSLLAETLLYEIGSVRVGA